MRKKIFLKKNTKPRSYNKILISVGAGEVAQ